MLMGEWIGLFMVAIILAADNFRVAVSLGLSADMKRSRRKWVAVAFSVFESITTMVGLVVGGMIASVFVFNLTEYIVPVLITGYGTYLLLRTQIKNIRKVTLDHRWLLYGFLPFSLSIDNLVVSAGVGIYQIQIIPFTVFVGLITFTISLSGLYLGKSIGGRLANK